MTLARITIICIALSVCAVDVRAYAFQQPTINAPANGDPVINLADKANLDLAAFVQWLAEIRGLKIVDDTDLAQIQNKVQFYGKTSVNKDTMFELVQAVLRSNNLALVKADVGGWYRIVPLADVRAFAATGKSDQFPRAEYMTAIFSLEHISPQQAEDYLRKLLYPSDRQNTSSITSITGRNVLIVSETAKLMKTIEEIVREIDIPKEALLTEFYKVKNLEATELKQQLDEILNQTISRPVPSAVTTNSPTANTITPDIDTLRITADVRTNRLIIIGTTRQMTYAMELIKQLDVELGLRLVKYQFDNVSASRIDELMKQTFVNLDENAVKRVYQSTVNEQSNQLIVTARDEVHQKIEDLRMELDVPGSATNARSPIRFYTLKNVKAIEILDTLQSIERRFQDSRIDQRTGPRGINTSDRFDGPGNAQLPGGRNQLDQTFFDDRAIRDGVFDRRGGSNDSLFGSGGFGNSVVGDIVRLANDRLEPENILPGSAKITIDENSNTLIVVAEPSIQQLYAELIEKLDQRRPQVLIEVNVVTVAANDNFRLGIEISGGDRDGGKRLFSFTNFGLSQIDAATGALSIGTGATGFNGTLVDPDVADIVLQALSGHNRARVIAAPRVLVNDNATGLLSSVAEVPFASNNSNNTVSTTSFGGFAEAGTTISVTPQISDDDYLNLEFDVLINDFAGEAAANLPPPRNTNQVTSQVSIPDGHTIIVGGLTRKSLTQNLDGLPFIERIPILSRLTSNEAQSSSDQRLFIFIKPTILRDDKFKDLRFVSELERRDACIPDDLPPSEPMLIGR